MRQRWHDPIKHLIRAARKRGRRARDSHRLSEALAARRAWFEAVTANELRVVERDFRFGMWWLTGEWVAAARPVSDLALTLPEGMSSSVWNLAGRMVLRDPRP